MTINDIVLGDLLMLFDASGKSIGGATNHSLSISPEYNEVQCKDSSYTGWKKLKKVSWEIQCEHLYLEAEFIKYMDNIMGDEELTVFFGKAADRTDGADEGLGSKTEWTKDTTGMMYTGKCKISSLSLNAQSGENATYSVTLTGTGALSKVA